MIERKMSTLKDGRRIVSLEVEHNIVTETDNFGTGGNTKLRNKIIKNNNPKQDLGDNLLQEDERMKWSLSSTRPF
ncbi:hypothetical protein TNCV_617281 [Trichonephila clavipes]|nr:hypothetical protein TNCV_617281 [Trichonephila clavipes]